MFVCHQNDDCEDYIGIVYVGGYCGLSEIGLCAFGKWFPVCFLVICECWTGLLQSVVMSYDNCDDDG